MSIKGIPDFTHLHLHTHYSLLDGMGKIDDILDKALEFKMDSVAITDHGVMYGVPEFYDKAIKRGLKPIAGCEFYLAPNGMTNKRPKIDENRHHLILLAENNKGYENLMKLASEAHLKGYYYKPRIDLEILKKYSEGLIGMSACIQGEIPQLLLAKKYQEAEKKALEYQEILGKGNFFLELQHLPTLKKQTIANEGLKKLSKKTGIPLVASADVHYVNPEDAEVQDILICIQTNRKITDTNRLSLVEHDLHFKSQQEIWEAFQDVPQAIENTQIIKNRCNITIEFGNTILPHFEVPEGETDITYLKKLCNQGLKWRYPDKKLLTPEHYERLEYELSVIEKMGFPSYFLIVQDFMNWARRQGIIVGPGRGSAAGSFVSYLTGITNLDPITYKLMFERFLNPDRVSMPDVDTDFADHRRDEVLQYCRDKYGHDRVAQIITFGTMAARAAIRDVGRVLDVEYSYCDKLAKTIPMFTSLNDAMRNTKELITEYKSNPNAKKIVDAAIKLEGIARHASVHACGVVITQEPVTKYSPLQNMAAKGKNTEGAVVTQYAASSKASYVEKIGLLKMDFLGLRNLTIIENALNIIKKSTGDIIDIENVPLDDEETYRLLQRGETTGVFQLESAGMKRYLKKLRPTVLEDVIAMVALYRPGPMEWIPDFIDGKHGNKKVTYLHPKLEPILKNTYGVAVYQEQVMELAKSIAGFTGGEADTLRKVMGKKIIEMIAEQKNKFIKGAQKTNQISKELAEKIFSFIEPFAGYGFNRSHAACYALIGYQTAYLKAHYPSQFMAALMNSDKDDTDRIAIEIEEAREMDIEVLPPSINESFKDFAVVMKNDKAKRPDIRFGLEAIKGVGNHIAEMIIEERKKNGNYKDVIDLVERVKDRDMNKKSLEALSMSGALDEMIERNKLLSNSEKILSYAKDYQKNASSGQSSLFTLGDDNLLDMPKITFDEVRKASRKEKLSWERQLLGLYVSDHPLRGYQGYFQANTTPIYQIGKQHANQLITIGGIVEKVQKKYTRNNQLMFFAHLEDGLGRIEVLVFPKSAEKTQHIWENEKIALIKGKVSDKDGELKILCEEAIELNEKDLKKYKDNKETTGSFMAQRNSIRHQKISFENGLQSKNQDPPATLTINLAENFKEGFWQEIGKLIKECDKGNCAVYFIAPDNNSRLKIPQKIKFGKTAEEKLSKLLKKDSFILDQI